MVELLSFLAEETSHAIAVIWSGFAIASELNYRLMTVIITSMSRIVQLLFLLTQKVAEVFSIITGDIMLFVGDIGIGTIAFINLFRSFITSLITLVIALFSGIGTSLHYLMQLISSLCNCIFNIFSILRHNIYSVFIIIRDVLILFGSSIIFLITFIPNLIHLLIYEAICAIRNLHIAMCVIISQFISDSQQFFHREVYNFITFFSHSPLNTAVGLGVLILLIVTVKIFWSKIRNISEVAVTSFGGNLKRIMFRCYSRNREAVDAEVVVVNDETGNYSNENHPERNLVFNPELIRPTNGLVRRPLTRFQRSLSIQNGSSDDEIVLNRKFPSKQLRNHNLSMSFENVANVLKKQLEDERDNQLCAICQEREKNIILLPCRHLCLCSKCSFCILKRDEPCPICRKVIRETLKVFL